jgi:dTDP-4-dehydrorhamnose reductase
MPTDSADRLAGIRVAVTGAGGRLGSALVEKLGREPRVRQVLAWDLPEHDLDDPSSAQRLVSAYRPDLVVHAAAWTDVDACAGQPRLALRRNGTAAGEMAEACVASGAALVLISTNEVFDGRRTDGRPYRPTDVAHPANPYGESKLAGERAARAAFGATGREFARAAQRPQAVHHPDVPALAIVRTAWLFGLPGADFPHKILARAREARSAGSALQLVCDEIGCPTYATDLAAAIAGLASESAQPGGPGPRGVYHIVNAGRASRAEWAREVLRLAGLDVPTREVSLEAWPRPSRPPAWGVLEPTPLPGGPLRHWREALAEYAELLLGHA